MRNKSNTYKLCYSDFSFHLKAQASSTILILHIPTWKCACDTSFWTTEKERFDRTQTCVTVSNSTKAKQHTLLVCTKGISELQKKALKYSTHTMLRPNIFLVDLKSLSCCSFCILHASELQKRKGKHAMNKGFIFILGQYLSRSTSIIF